MLTVLVGCSDVLFARPSLMGMGIILSLVGGTVIVSYVITPFGMLCFLQLSLHLCLLDEGFHPWSLAPC